MNKKISMRKSSAFILILTALLGYTLGAAYAYKPPSVLGFRSTSSFGVRIHPVTGEKKCHKGTDYNKGPGQVPFQATAATSGTVTSVSNQSGGGGNIIELTADCGTFKTRYMHSDSVVVSQGQKVQEGQVLAQHTSAKGTGSSTGNHIHFETHVKASDGKWYFVDPQAVAQLTAGGADPCAADFADKALALSKQGTGAACVVETSAPGSGGTGPGDGGEGPINGGGNGSGSGGWGSSGLGSCNGGLGSTANYSMGAGLAMAMLEQAFKSQFMTPNMISQLACPDMMAQTSQNNVLPTFSQNSGAFGSIITGLLGGLMKGLGMTSGLMSPGSGMMPIGGGMGSIYSGLQGGMGSFGSLTGGSCANRNMSIFQSMGSPNMMFGSPTINGLLK